MTQISERTVLFADLRGSTSMYETLGNAEATAVVTRSVALLGAHRRRARRPGRQDARRRPDGGVRRRRDARGACRLADADARRRSTGASVDARDGEAAARLRRARRCRCKLQVGAGARRGGRDGAATVFGDAVNVAARLLDHAGDNETLVTASVRRAASASWERSRFRSLDRMQLRGRVEPVHVHLLEPVRRFGDTAATAFGDMLSPVAEPEGIRLVWLDLNRIYAGTSLPVVLGRSPQATYIIDDTRVSRSHARIDWHGGTLPAHRPQLQRHLRPLRQRPARSSACAAARARCTAAAPSASARRRSEPISPCVRFEVLRFADTQRQAPFEFGLKS